MSIAALIATVVGYGLFFFTELYTLSTIIMIASFIVGIIDLVMFYCAEKPTMSDFVKDAFRERFGSSIAVLAGICFIILLITI